MRRVGRCVNAVVGSDRGGYRRSVDTDTWREGRKAKGKHNRNACRRQRKKTISVLTGDKRHRRERMHTQSPDMYINCLHV